MTRILTRRWLTRFAAVACGWCALSAPLQAQAPPPAPAPNPTELYNAAVASFDRGDYQGAVGIIQKLFSQIPADLPPPDKIKLTAELEPLYFTLGAAYFNLKDFPKAIEAFKDYLTRYPHGTREGEAKFSLAQAAFFAQTYADAAVAFAALENDPAYREQALLFEGLSYKAAEKIDEAISAFEKLVASGIRTPTGARGAMQLVLLYATKSQPDKASKMLTDLETNVAQVENIIELNSIALAQGDAYLENGAGKEALACFRAVRVRSEVIALQRERVAALQRRFEATKAAMRANPRQAGQYLLTNKQTQDAIAENQALALTFEKTPDFRPKLQYRIGRAFALLGQPWESLVAFNDVIRASKDPADREPALYAAATAYVDAGQMSDAREMCDAYLKDFPKGPNAFAVGYLLGATALQENDPQAAESYFGRMLDSQPGSPLAGDMRFLLGNARFAQGKYPEATVEYTRYQQDFPTGPHKEETVYRIALAALFGGKYEEALRRLEDYLTAYPRGGFIVDAKYRRAVCLYAGQRYDDVKAACQDWLRQHFEEPQRGEILSLLGDAYAATGKTDEALDTYIRSYKAAVTAEVLSYSLMEAAKILQKRGDWPRIGGMFEAFVREQPDHPLVPMAMNWIARAKTKEGKVDEAKRFLAENIKRYLHDRQREGVEGLLDQLAALCLRRKPSASVSPALSPSPGGETVAAASPSPAPTDPGAELADLLHGTEQDKNPTAQARVLYAKSQLARMRRQDAEADRLLLEMAARFRPHDLSGLLQGQAGDVLLAAGKLDEASEYYQALLDDFPKSNWLDYAYNGLGEVALRRQKNEEALGYFSDGTTKIPAAVKLKDLTLGKARALLALNRYDEAKKLFEQVAATREWRGEATAASVFSLGEIEAKQGRWAEANAHYQRVYVAYQRFLPWVAKAYLGSAQSFEKLGKRQDAVNTYRDMLHNQKLSDLPEAAEARRRLEALGAG